MSQHYGVLERTTMAAYAAMASATMAMPPKRDFYPQLVTRVVAVRQVAPAWRRVTLEAAELRDIRLTGPDEYVGLYMPPPAMPVRMPANALNPRPALDKIPEAERPDLRWYTIRAHRPELGEVDIDIVAVGHDGPGARWIAGVCEGDEVGLRVQVAPYASAPPSGHHLLLGDETGLPGMLAILDRYRGDAGRRFTTIVELPTEDYLHPEMDSLGVIAVYRGADAPGQMLLPAVESADLAPVDYAWVCAEAGTAAAIRRHLTKGRGVPRRAVMSSGFWKVGRERL